MTDQDDLATSLQSLAAGQFDTLPSGDDPVSTAVRALAALMKAEAKESLDRTVRFSMNASEAMTSVAQMTSDLLETDNRTQTMASAVEELTASIGQITEASNTAAELASSSNSASEEGVQKINEAVRYMNRISDVVQSVNSRTETLSDASNQIAGILETIDAIAKQTNLLALNATIEAARAGEHGKGFAVVAGEVKNLANQTSRATEDIRHRIDLLTTEISALLDSVSGVLEEVEQGKKAVDDTGEGIRTIRREVGEVSTRMTEIANMLTEQTQAVREIGSGVASVAELSGRNRKRTEKAIGSVGATESLIEEQFAKLEKIEIEDYVLFRAKSDHFTWKKKLAEMFVGLNNLREEELADHHQCRLGKWYDQMDDRWFKDNPAFANLVGPHARVHQSGKEAARMHMQGNRDKAEQLFEEMETASIEVVSLLDQLINERRK